MMVQEYLNNAQSPVNRTESTVYCVTVYCPSSSLFVLFRYLEMHKLICLDQSLNITLWLSQSEALATRQINTPVGKGL